MSCKPNNTLTDLKLLFFHLVTDSSVQPLNKSQLAEISHESSSCGQCLLEYLLERLQVESCHVKLKVGSVDSEDSKRLP